MPHLRLSVPPADGRPGRTTVLPLEEADHPGGLTFGRDPACEVVLDNPAVSRRHLRVRPAAAGEGESPGGGAGWVAEDLGSRNRTTVNGADLAGPTRLADGDRVEFCDATLLFLTGPPAPAGPAAPPAALGDTGDADAVTLSAPPEDDAPGVITSVPAYGPAGRTGGTGLFRLDVNPAEKLRAVLSITRALAGREALDDILDGTLEDLFRAFPQADRGFVLLADAPGGPPRVRASRARGAAGGGVGGAGEAGAAVRVSRTIVRRVMDAGEAILSGDVAGDGRFDASESITDLQLRSVLCVPLPARDGTAFGVLQLDTSDPTRQFSADDLDLLLAVAAPVGLAAENARLSAQAAARREAERDLEMAARIQKGFLPKSPPPLPGYAFADYYGADQTVGGDYFDYVPLPDGRVVVALGDVAGKGVPASLLMARMSAAARGHILGAAREKSPDLLPAALGALNRDLSGGPLGHRFITCVLLLVDPAAHRLHVVNAGHMAPLVRRADGTVTEPDAAGGGMPIGIDEGQTFANVSVPLGRGDAAVVFTDGITEAVREGAGDGKPDGGGLSERAENLYGKDRLAAALRAAAGPPTDLLAAVRADVTRWTGCGPQTDDICLVAVGRE